jgi:hypothetical protein
LVDDDKQLDIAEYATRDPAGLYPQIDLDQVRLITGDTDRVKVGGGSASARSMRLGAWVMAKAADEIIEKGRKIAAAMLEVAEQDIKFARQRFVVTGTDCSFAQVLLVGLWLFQNGCTAEHHSNDDGSAADLVRLFSRPMMGPRGRLRGRCRPAGKGLYRLPRSAEGTEAKLAACLERPGEQPGRLTGNTGTNVDAVGRHSASDSLATIGKSSWIRTCVRLAAVS